MHEQLAVLARRTTLTKEQQHQLYRQKHGYSGELLFANLLENELQCEPIILFSLDLVVNDNEFQVDCLLLFQNKAILIEVKHFRGDYIFENNDWFTSSKNIISNPIQQLQRSELLLQKLFKQQQIPLTIQSFAVFTHPEFHLYQSPMHLPIVFPTQLKRFVQKLKNNPCHIQGRHHKIAKLLTSIAEQTALHQPELNFNYEQLRKGVTCGACHGMMHEHNLKLLSCPDCGESEPVAQAMIRNINDFQILFPHKKITVGKIVDWTGSLFSRYKIRKKLSGHSELIRKGKKSYYILNKSIK